MWCIDRTSGTLQQILTMVAMNVLCAKDVPGTVTSKRFAPDVWGLSGESTRAVNSPFLILGEILH